MSNTLMSLNVKSIFISFKGILVYPKCKHQNKYRIYRLSQIKYCPKCGE